MSRGPVWWTAYFPCDPPCPSPCDCPRPYDTDTGLLHKGSNEGSFGRRSDISVGRHISGIVSVTPESREMPKKTGRRRDDLGFLRPPKFRGAHFMVQDAGRYGSDSSDSDLSDEEGWGFHERMAPEIDQRAKHWLATNPFQHDQFADIDSRGRADVGHFSPYLTERVPSDELMME